MSKNMPVGIDDFGKLIENNYYFVDKSRFIKDILDHRTEVTLITRPRRFGKTLMLSMLEYFFTLDNAAANRRLFNGMAIEQAGAQYMQEQGTRPVVRMTFKDIKYNTWQGQREKIANSLSKLYRRHIFLLESAALNKFDRDYFVSVCKKTARPTDMEDAIANLCEMLSRHWGKKPILLLDEYDTPIISAWDNNYYDECMVFMRNFLSAALKNNEYLDFAVVTGITRVSKESIFSGLNNLTVCGVLSKFYADIFGFTPQETQKLLNDSGYAGKAADFKRWYDGYIFGIQEIYNPWSAINFVQNDCDFRPYWVNVSENTIIQELLKNIDSERQKEISSLMQGNTVETPLKENIAYADLHTGRDPLYMMLLTTGYLKAVKIFRDHKDTEWIRLKIPNREVLTLYEAEISRYIVPHRGEVLLYNMLNAMTAGDDTVFENNFSAVLLNYVSFHDAAQPESFYHGLLLGLSVYLGDIYRVESNRESGYGRFDLAFFPLRNNCAGVILEIKTVKTEDELEKQAEAALKQISDKSYVTALKKQGVAQIWSYGIAVCGKKASIKRN